MKRFIVQLFELQLPQISIDTIKEIAKKWIPDEIYRDSLKEINKIEKSWGPIGIWSAKYEGRRFFFRYPQKYDSIYRQYKYVYMPLLTGSPSRPGVTRGIVHYSAMHVEGCLKLFCRNKGYNNYERKWIVPLVKICEKDLDNEIIKSLILLGSKISNPAKHQYNVGVNDSLFSAPDAIGMYLICRKLGFKILSQSEELFEIEKACQTGPFFSTNLYL